MADCLGCRGTGFVVNYKDSRGEDAIRSTNSDNPEGYPCPYCEGSGEKGQDHDLQVEHINVPDSEGNPGELIEMTCRRVSPIGSDHPIECNVKFSLDSSAMTLKGLSPGNLKVIAAHLRDYAERMGKW